MILRRLSLLLLTAAAVAVSSTLCLPTPAIAQDGEGGSGFAGVVVDTEGVLRKQTFPDPAGQLTRQRIQAAKANLDPKLAATSKLRKVSLNRLEQALKARLDDDQQATDEMRYLAGLTRIQYVFYYPDTKDIVIAGPAEGWAENLAGRVCGINSGRPTILLEDLVVALRAYGPGQKGTSLISCSIDPTQEGLQRMQTFLKSIGSRATPADTQFIVEGLRENLGLQTVRITGVPATTHFAQVLVEADYRMKLIGIGLETPPIKLASYIEKANPATVARNALQRWFFVPDYECVRVSDDELAMELVGEGVKLVGADEMVSHDGSRKQVARADKASMLFVEGFTRKYPELAAKSPVYAQLRNLIDLAVAAAFIQKYDYYGQAGWTMPVLGDESKVPVETATAPTQVGTAVASVWKGNRLMTPVGGGVVVKPQQALDPTKLIADEDGKVATARDQVDLTKLAKDQWWWD